MYFSDRELGSKPRTLEEIPLNVWGGIYVIFQKKVADGSFGFSYPEQCSDGGGNICGCDQDLLELSIQSEIPDLGWPLSPKALPAMLSIIDFIEFLYRAAGKPIEYYYHNYMRHSHLSFDEAAGKSEFRDEINRIFVRNGVAFELNEQGQVIRLGSDILRQDLMSATFQTGDSELDRLLNTARIKYLNPDLEVRKEALEKLWDAFERLKTIEPGQSKKYSVEALLNRVSPESGFRDLLDKELKELTQIGNNFMIRHTEVGKTPLQTSEDVDYLFARLFAAINLLLSKTGKLSQRTEVNGSVDDLEDIPF